MCSHISKFGQNRGISALFLSRISTMLKFGTQKANHRFTVACQIRPSMLWVWEPHQYFKIGQILVFCPCRRDAMLLHSQPQLHLLHVYIISNFLIVTFAITTTGVRSQPQLQVYMPTVCICAHARYLYHVYHTHNTQVGMLSCWNTLFISPPCYDVTDALTEHDNWNEKEHYSFTPDFILTSTRL